MGELFRFAVVGTIGFVVDVAALQLFAGPLGAGLYLGRVFSFLVAASVTWYLNARFTFRVERLGLAQWLRFLAANSVGASANYAVYAALIALGGVPSEFPAIAVGCGSLAGLAFNFAASRHFVFARRA